MKTEAAATTSSDRPTLLVDVVMRREPVTGPMSRWQNWQWVLGDVMPHPPSDTPAGNGLVNAPEPKPVEPIGGERDVPGASHWLYADMPVQLFRDDAEGYYLNLNSPQPCFWVFWRADESRLLEGEAMAVPQIVTLSYHDAGRWLDAQERVDQVTAQPPVVAWLADFVQAHYQPEPKRRKRPDSFKPLTDRFGQPVRISTEKPGRSGGGGHGG